MSSCTTFHSTPCDRCGKVWWHGPYTFLCNECHIKLLEEHKRKKEEQKC